jgi:hypothetical protein
MIYLAKCLDCGGKAVKDGLFYKCLGCGLTMTLQEFSRQRDNITKKRYEADLQGDDDAKKKKQNDMMRWYMKQSD